ncbi:MAG: isocitrate/isopropylmalate family dehydrogenase, partial [Phycisphaerae bacterium]
MAFQDLVPPAKGSPSSKSTDSLHVPDEPIVPFIEGDGTGRDIWKAASRVFDAAVETAYGDRRRIAWFEVFAGQKSYDKYGTWLPEDTIEAFIRVIESRQKGE